MDIVTAGRACLRRWYLVIPILAIGIFASYHVAKATKPTYAAVAEFVILDSGQQPVKATPTKAPSTKAPATGKNKASATPTAAPTAPATPQPTVTAVNPYKGASSTLRGTLLAQLNDAAFQKQFADQGLKGSYVVGGKKKSSLIDITASARRPKTAVDLANAVLAKTNAQIHEIQTSAGSPSDQLTGTRPVLSATKASDVTPGKSKKIVAGIVITIAAAIALAIALDSAVLARRRRRAARATAEGEGTPREVEGVPAGGRQGAGDAGAAPEHTEAATTDTEAEGGSWLGGMSGDDSASAERRPPADPSAVDSGPITRLSGRRSRTGR